MKKYIIFFLLVVTACINEDKLMLEGKSYLKDNRYDEAMVAFTKVIKQNPKNEYPYFYRGLILQERNLYNQAIADFKFVTPENTNYIEAVNNIGDCYFKMGDTKKALKYFKVAHELDSNKINLNYNLAVCYLYLQDYKKALLHAKKEHEINNIDIHNIFLQAKLYGAVGDYSLSIKIANVGLAKKESAEGYFIRGSSYFEMNRFESAIKDLTKAINLSQEASYYTMRASAYGELKYFDKALDDCSAALDLDPNFINAYKVRIILNSELGRYDDAKSDSIILKELSPPPAAARILSCGKSNL